MAYYVYFCEVTDSKKEGLNIRYPFFGGDYKTEGEANAVARKLVNEAPNQVTIIPKIFDSDDKPASVAEKRFELMAEQMYKCQEIMERRKKRKKS